MIRVLDAFPLCHICRTLTLTRHIQLCDICERESTSSRSPFKSAKSLSAIFLAAIIVISSTPSMSAFNSSINLRFKRSKFVMNSSHDLDDCANIYTERRQGKIGRMSIISRTIYLDCEVDSIMQHKGEDFVRQEIKRLNVTVWEMDKPSELIQEWWSIDESERCSRVGDPFGVVMWPGSILVSKELLKLHYSNQLKSPIVGATVLVLGAGTGNLHCYTIGYYIILPLLTAHSLFDRCGGPNSRIVGCKKGDCNRHQPTYIEAVRIWCKKCWNIRNP